MYVRAFHPKTTTEARMRFLAAYAHTRNLIWQRKILNVKFELRKQELDQVLVIPL